MTMTIEQALESISRRFQSVIPVDKAVVPAAEWALVAAEWMGRAEAGDMPSDTARHAHIAAGQIEAAIRARSAT